MLNSRLRLVALATLVAALAACSGEKAPTTGADGKPLKVYRHSEDGNPTTLDPVQAAVTYSNIVVVNVYDTLYTYKYLKRPYELKPNLATSLPKVSDDGLTYTFKIKQGVEYIDDEAFPDGTGREVVAQDFVYSLKRHFDPANRSLGSWLWTGKIAGLDDWGKNGADYDKPVEGLQALDDYTIQIKLTKPFPQLPYTFAMGFSAFVPHEAVKHYGRELSVNPVGSGPFKLERFSTAKAVFVPNPKFRQEPVDLEYEGYDPAIHGKYGVAAIDGRSPPFVDRMEIDFIQETAARWASFTKGSEVQWSWPPVEQVDNVTKTKQPLVLKDEYAEKYHYYPDSEPAVVYTYMNMDGKLGDDGTPEEDAKNKALRCAMVKAFDWDERNERFYNGIGAVYPGIIPPAVPEFDPDMDRWSVEHDLDAAKKLLADAGWTPASLPSITYGHSAGVTQRQIGEHFRGFMTALGWPIDKIELKGYATFGDFNRAIKNSQLDVGGLAWQLDYPDAENVLQLFYGPYETPGSNNANYKNAEYDALYEKTSVMQPSAERTKLYRKMNQMIVDDCVQMMGLSRTRAYMWHKDVIGFPDRHILGGQWIRYVDVKTPEAAG